MSAALEWVHDKDKTVWWLADLGFIAATAGVLQVDKAQKKFVSLLNDTIYPAYLGSEAVPERWKKNVKSMAPHVVLRLTQLLITLTMAQTVLTLDYRPRVFSFLYLFYGYCWNYGLLNDVIMDDDISGYSLLKKQIHVMVPLGLEAKKIMKSGDLHMKQIKKQVGVILREALDQESKGGRSGRIIEGLMASALVLPIMLGPSWIKALSLTAMYPFMLNFLNVVFQVGSLLLLGNKYPLLFGDNIKLLQSNTRNCEHGLQYEYFRNGNVYFNNFLHKKVFKKFKGYDGGSRVAKAAMILARGLIVVPAFALMFPDVDATSAALAMTYYGLHAAFAYYHHGKDDLGEIDPVRYPVAAVEFILCSFLWSQPLLGNSSLKGTFVNAGPDLISFMSSKQ